jgi:hypothetical protein
MQKNQFAIRRTNYMAAKKKAKKKATKKAAKKRR